ncbi:hypothetical protein [Legionella saoudiensis]|uniref:hypothetical protein n=1 Tax=Legionella saoudiensis TaxID=1750561 RepID=UPI0007301FF2|nr:hypothetical protein [Legionella saoudiensis]
MKKLIIATLLIGFNTAALADSTIVIHTKTWKSVPITVDTEKNIYIIQGTPPESNFYYTYSGYRCLREETNIVGVNAVVYHSNIPGEGDIYCYPE